MFQYLDAIRGMFAKRGYLLRTSKVAVVPALLADAIVAAGLNLRYSSAFQNNLEIPSADWIKEQMSDIKLITVDAGKLAKDAGSILSQNVVMLGAAAKILPLKKESLLKAVEELVPKKTVEINKKAFLLGYESA